MRYIELTIAVPAEQTEPAAEILRDLTAGGAWIETPFTQPDLESDAVVATAVTHVVHAYLPADTDRGGVVLEARERLTAAGVSSDIDARVIADEDWAEAWKEHFGVERYGERIVVVPSWRDYTPRPDDVVLTLDPGMAFGTGQHETTRMCLEALERVVVPGARVLDVGCGSGILAIAAAKLGAAAVDALDIDPICVRVTTDNASKNAVSVRVGEGTLGDGWPWPEPPAKYDVIVANIIAAAIIGMADDLAVALSPAGRLIVSGIIAERESEVVRALQGHGLRIDSTRAMGEWRCIEAVRA